MEKQKNGNELTETKNIFVVAKVKVQSPVELTNDFEMFKLRWKRTTTEALQTIGEVKVVDIIT